MPQRLQRARRVRRGRVLLRAGVYEVRLLQVRVPGGLQPEEFLQGRQVAFIDEKRRKDWTTEGRKTMRDEVCKVASHWHTEAEFNRTFNVDAASTAGPEATDDEEAKCECDIGWGGGLTA